MTKRREISFLYPDEVIACFKFINNKRSKLLPIIQLAFETGLRFEDIIELKNRDVRKQDDGYYSVRFNRSKKWNDAGDIVFIRPELMQNIRKYYNRSSYFIFDKKGEKTEIDRDSYKKAMYKNLRYWIRQAIQGVLNFSDDQMQGIGFHITRRTFMTIGVLSSQFTFEQGSRHLGHSSPRITERYYGELRRNSRNSVINYFNL